MTKIVDFTIWNTETREVYSFGQCAEGGRVVELPLKVYYGAQLDENYIFDENDQPILRPTPLPVTTEDIVRFLRQIDQAAEEIRGLFITNTPSQPAVYMAKEAEANALMADPEISETLTPNLTFEAARTGESRFDVAVVILTQANTWRQLSAMIEDRRLAAKDQVRATGEPVTVDWSDIAAMAPPA